MKKTLSLVLALMLILSLVACGNQADKSSAGPVAEEVQGVTIPEFSVTVNGVAVDQTAMAAYPM